MRFMIPACFFNVMRARRSHGTVAGWFLVTETDLLRRADLCVLRVAFCACSSFYESSSSCFSGLRVIHFLFDRRDVGYPKRKNGSGTRQ